MSTDPSHLYQALKRTFPSMPDQFAQRLAVQIVRLYEKFTTANGPLNRDFRLAIHIDHSTELSTKLRTLRSAVKLEQQRIVSDTGWSLSKVVRIENGEVGVTKTDLRAYLDAIGVTDKQLRQHMEELAERDRSRRRGR